LSQRKA